MIFLQCITIFLIKKGGESGADEAGREESEVVLFFVGDEADVGEVDAGCG